MRILWRGEGDCEGRGGGGYCGEGCVRGERSCEGRLMLSVDRAC